MTTPRAMARRFSGLAPSESTRFSLASMGRRAARRVGSVVGSDRREEVGRVQTDGQQYQAVAGALGRDAGESAATCENNSAVGW